MEQLFKVQSTAVHLGSINRSGLSSNNQPQERSRIDNMSSMSSSNDNNSNSNDINNDININKTYNKTKVNRNKNDNNNHNFSSTTSIYKRSNSVRKITSTIQNIFSIRKPTHVAPLLSSLSSRFIVGNDNNSIGDNSHSTGNNNNSDQGESNNSIKSLNTLSSSVVGGR